MSSFTPTGDPELQEVSRGRRGRLHLYLGYAAGVGKTYRMLEDAQQLARQG
jgi:two-component system sensor histidine kinase KdpD